LVGGEVRLVVVAPHRMSDDIKSGTLASMIRQSGLPKKLFRSIEKIAWQDALDIA
jgi:hypothetical protein